MLQKTRLGKCAGEVGSGSKGGINTNSVQYIIWDKMLVDADYLEELVKNQLISESAAPKKVWMEHPRLQKYILVSFQSALNKNLKNKYQFHTQPPIKKQPLKVHAQVSSLFSMMETDSKDECKGKLLGILAVHLIIVC